MFPALPLWMVWAALALFPLTIALTELPTYYGYAMPRIRERVGGVWWVPLLPYLMALHGLLDLQLQLMPLVVASGVRLW